LIAASALRTSGLSALASLSELTSTLTLLPASTRISALARLTGLPAGILRTLRSSSCLSRQTAIHQSLNLVLKLTIVRAGPLTSSATLTTTSACIRLAQRHRCPSERISGFRIGYRSRNRSGRRSADWSRR
jgi:hypothetical protein